MRLAETIYVDGAGTFGKLRFSTMRREVKEEGQNGEVSDTVKRRTYDLKSSVQGQMIQVSLPAEVEAKDFPYNAEVELVNPIGDTVTNKNFNSTSTTWYFKADDMVLKNPGTNKQQGQRPQPNQKPQNHDPNHKE